MISLEMKAKFREIAKRLFAKFRNRKHLDGYSQIARMNRKECCSGNHPPSRPRGCLPFQIVPVGMKSTYAVIFSQDCAGNVSALFIYKQRFESVEGLQDVLKL